jgi:trehalose/maltose hydrolase-like predicted phosphorylase
MRIHLFVPGRYWRVTKDLSTGWLDQIAWPILSGVADFWVSKTAVDNPDAGPDDPLHIKDVIPPDEYADHVTDSIYTNSVAVLSLQYAIETAILLGKEEEVASSISSWRSVADRIVCITAENEDGVWHPEYEGYSLETIKQADAVLLGYPLGEKPFLSFVFFCFLYLVAFKKIYSSHLYIVV